MKNPADPNGNIYEALGVEPPYTIDPADHMRRRAVEMAHRARRAAAQAVLLQSLPPDAAAAVQVTLLQMEAETQTERHELDAEWFHTTLRAHRAGQEAGRADGYTEGVTDMNLACSTTPEITH